ncbi:hypothetical protein GGR51DRAFT_273246 [Nemania sp. FL0031]|nr:hypothetical protein GGR51DRAFT_273246 [Nemania sp. FL0031]
MSENTTPFWTSTSTPMPTLDDYPPLTTLFTPDPSCASFYISQSSSDSPDSSDHATAFPKAACLDESGLSTVRDSLSCYPKTTRGDPLLTYSPGYFCPVGMTTVESVSIKDGTWCCPKGLTLADGVCQKTTSQATLLFTDIDSCSNAEIVTVQRIIDGGGGIVISAAPIYLIGQKLPTTTPFTSVSPSSIASSSSTTSASSIMSPVTTASPTSTTSPKSAQTSDPRATSTNQNSLSLSAMIGIILGSILGIVILSILAGIYIWKRVRAKAATKEQSKQVVKAEPDERIGKPELEGSKAYVYTARVELDAGAIRAELEGDIPGEPYGDGIYVFKPELEGATGTERNRGAFVMKKSELDATSIPCASTVRHDIAELEATTSSARAGTSIATQSDIQRR